MVTRKRSDVVQLSKIRMRESLRQKLARHAEGNGLTLNAEIVRRLERSLLDEDILTELRNSLRKMEETQDQQYERFLAELQEQQLADAQGLDDGEG
jgi:hypothetical protein